jgi:mono/diheme cytochrome c family protein
VTKNIAAAILLVAGVGVALIALVIGAGMYNVAADDGHTRFVSWLLETTRERSIAVRADGIRVPELSDPQRIRSGAGNYDAMCASCHLAPGVEATEISRGLNPEPPNLTKSTQVDPARAFWIIKHGIKATGMPAWGKSMQDEYIWDMVALLLKLPEMTPDEYRREVRASGGHSHDGGESDEDAVEPNSHDH